MDYETRGRNDEYDDEFLRKALEKKKLGESSAAHHHSRDRLDRMEKRNDSDNYRGPPPLPTSPPSGYPEEYQLPYDQESTASSKRSNLRKVSQQWCAKSFWGEGAEGGQLVACETLFFDVRN